MLRALFAKVWLIAFLVVGVAGCGAWQGSSEEAGMDDEFPELGDAFDEPESDMADASQSQQLQLNLQVGDRFPLLKSVDQELSQPSPQGLVTSRSQLELMMAIEVEEVQAQRKRLGVRYHRVRYSHDVAGERVEYDSNAPQYPLPEAVMAYQGLIDNGFSFWIGADNQILELVGFHDFLRRCVRHVPPESQQAVLTTLAATQGEEGIANFVDDSIGLLPYNVSENAEGSTVKVGDTWTRQRQVVRPVPLWLTTNYTLKSANSQTAEIDILGRIAPSTTYGPSNQPQQGVSLIVRGGHCMGNCVIDRTTGLPIESRVERTLDMQVQLADGTSFEQSKRIITTIRAFPEQGSASQTGVGNALTHAPQPTSAPTPTGYPVVNGQPAYGQAGYGQPANGQNKYQPAGYPAQSGVQQAGGVNHASFNQ